MPPNQPVRELSTTPQYTAANVRALRNFLKVSRGWTANRFAKELTYSVAYVKKMQSGEMRVSDRVAVQLRRLERDAAFIAKETDATEAELPEWLLTALEQRRAHVKGNVLKRLQKLLEDR